MAMAAMADDHASAMQRNEELHAQELLRMQSEHSIEMDQVSTEHAASLEQQSQAFQTQVEEAMHAMELSQTLLDRTQTTVFAGLAKALDVAKEEVETARSEAAATAAAQQELAVPTAGRQSTPRLIRTTIAEQLAVLTSVMPLPDELQRGAQRAETEAATARKEAEEAKTRLAEAEERWEEERAMREKRSAEKIAFVEQDLAQIKEELAEARVLLGEREAALDGVEVRARESAASALSDAQDYFGFLLKRAL
eukprot:507559-Rhodomonas_salina.1